jgi:hypothetical protein
MIGGKAAGIIQHAQVRTFGETLLIEVSPCSEILGGLRTGRQNIPSWFRDVVLSFTLQALIFSLFE